jgi:NTP pyrophosphatase (non-canonical NTP hydrolase)
MSLNAYKIQTKEMCKHMGWDKVDIPHLWLFLIEEVGELASAIRRTTTEFADKKRVHIDAEIIDVMSYLFQIADKFEIDLDQAWNDRKKKESFH